MTNKTQQLTTGANELEVVGTLIENNLELKVSKSGRNYVSGYVKVRTGENEDQYINVFEMEKTKSGKDNPSYQSIATSMKGMKSLADIIAMTPEGQEPESEPTYIQITGELDRNEYFNTRSGELVSEQRLKGKFFSSQRSFDSEGNKRPAKAEFKASGIIEKLNEFEDNGKPMLRLSLLVPSWNGNIRPFEFTVRDPQGVDAITSQFGMGDAFLITSGLARNFFKEEQIVEEAMWGAPEVTTVRKALREWEIKGMTRPTGTNYEDNPELVREAKNVREQYLASLESKAKERDTQRGDSSNDSPFAATTTANNDPFAVNTNAKTKTEEVPVEAFEELGDLFG